MKLCFITSAKIHHLDEHSVTVASFYGQTRIFPVRFTAYVKSDTLHFSLSVYLCKSCLYVQIFRVVFDDAGSPAASAQSGVIKVVSRNPSVSTSMSRGSNVSPSKVTPSFPDGPASALQCSASTLLALVGVGRPVAQGHGGGCEQWNVAVRLMYNGAHHHWRCTARKTGINNELTLPGSPPPCGACMVGQELCIATIAPLLRLAECPSQAIF